MNINQKNNGVCFSNFCDKYSIPNIKILTTTEDNIEIYKNFIELTNNFEDNKDTYIFNNRLYISRIDTEINGTGKCIQSLLEFDKENLEIKNNSCIYKKDFRIENFNLMNAIAIINYTIGKNFHNPFEENKYYKVFGKQLKDSKEVSEKLFEDNLKKYNNVFETLYYTCKEYDIAFIKEIYDKINDKAVNGDKNGRNIPITLGVYINELCKINSNKVKWDSFDTTDVNINDYKQQDKLVRFSSCNKYNNKEKLNMMFDDILKTIKNEYPYDDRYTLEEKIKKFKDTLN